MIESELVVYMEYIWNVDDFAVFVRNDPDPNDNIDDRYILKLPRDLVEEMGHPDRIIVSIDPEIEGEHDPNDDPANDIPEPPPLEPEIDPMDG